MKVIRFVLLVCAVLFALPTNSQVLRTGLLVGGGLGFEHNLTPNSGRPDIWQEGDYKIDYKDKYQFGASLGYRFRIEHGKNDRLFYDMDLILDAKVFKNTKSYYVDNELASRIIGHDANLALSLSPSVNYRLVKGLYVGMGIEPTWYMVPTNDGKKFDIPLVWKVGYNINNKIDLAINYRLGFTNVIDDRIYKKGHISDLNLSIFILFTISKK